MRELAEYLKSERLKRGLTLDDVSRKVSLSSNILGAMEEGAFEKIGTPLLIRRFIVLYCSALGIDPTELLEKYAAEINSINMQREGIERYSRSQEAFRSKAPWRPILFVIALALVASAIYAGVWLYETRQNMAGHQSLKREGYPQQEIPPDLSEKSTGGARDNAPNETSSERADSSVRDELPAGEDERAGSETGGLPLEGQALAEVSANAPASEMDENGSTGQGTDTADTERVQGVSPMNGEASLAVSGEESDRREEKAENLLRVQALEETWIQVRIDETTTRSVLMKAGDSREWAAEETVQVVLGNVGGVKMEWNGQALNLPGGAGSVLRFQLPDTKFLDHR